MLDIQHYVIPTQYSHPNTNFDFSGKLAFESWLLSLTNIALVPTCHFLLFSAEHLYQNVRTDRGIPLS